MVTNVVWVSHIYGQDTRHFNPLVWLLKLQIKGNICQQQELLHSTTASQGKRWKPEHLNQPWVVSTELWECRDWEMFRHGGGSNWKFLCSPFHHFSVRIDPESHLFGMIDTVQVLAGQGRAAQGLLGMVPVALEDFILQLPTDGVGLVSPVGTESSFRVKTSQERQKYCLYY